MHKIKLYWLVYCVYLLLQYVTSSYRGIVAPSQPLAYTWTSCHIRQKHRCGVFIVGMWTDDLGGTKDRINATLRPPTFAISVVSCAAWVLCIWGWDLLSPYIFIYSFFLQYEKNYVFFALRYKSLTYTRHAYSERPKSSKRNSLRRNRPYITQKLNNQEMGGALTQEMAFHRRCFLRVPAPVFGSRARDASTLEA